MKRRPETSEDVLRCLFDDRHELYQLATENILKLIEPTVIAALRKILSAKKNAITWMDVELSDNFLLMVGSVNYKRDEAPPEILASTAKIITEDGNVDYVFRVGLPVDVVFSNEEYIVEYINNIKDDEQQEVDDTVEIIDDGSQSVALTSNFDPSALTEEQIESFHLFYQPTPLPTKH